MPILIPVLLSYVLLIASTRAQVNAPSCTTSNLAWSFNSLQQSPCLVAGFLAAVCTNGVSSIPALQPGNSYSGPSGPDNSDQCKCNTVLYNLISACDACQGEQWVPYTTWSANCTTDATAGTFPGPIPDGTRVPQWAYIDTSADTWNIAAAQAKGDSPEVTGSSLIVPTSTSRVSPSTTTPSTVPSATSSGSSPTSTSQSNSKAGAIAGGVVGGVVGAALITVVAAWFFIRRRHAGSPPSDRSGQGSEMGQPMPAPYPLTGDTPRLYDPSDPATFPSHEYLPPSDQRFDSVSARFMQPNNPEYRGLPEI